ncbi:MAG: MBL fold metallo-hydrolase [Deltaproteobacteria bacterium]|nr:MBL fold metallo-hydrolase [Deltaproteobacteria bacterium]MBW2050593.1 MBL fold metallo-hydrolase [Deltaproteobacteria bacterium]HDZ89821.1 MBL fold metallo-hydrolase [Deltaproteobacteria bacterium]
MNSPSVTLRPVDRVEILTVIDNYVDVLLTNTEVITRPPLSKTGTIPVDTLLAEHGLSLLVTVYDGEGAHTVLFDTGYTSMGVPHNLDRLGVDLTRVEALVLSHGHMDHTGSLYAVLDRIPGTIPLVVHPGAFEATRYFGLADGRKLLFPRILKRDELEKRNVELVERKTPSSLAHERIMVTGQVERITPFEKGLPNAVLERDGKVENDPIADDQALVINLRDRGLVVISGCSHAGIVNTILYARKLTGMEKVHAVMGGFHLSGPYFEKIIEQTIEEFRKMAPDYLVPMHCTGWKAIQRMSQEFQDQFILNSVGSTITLKGPVQA